MGLCLCALDGGAKSLLMVCCCLGVVGVVVGFCTLSTIRATTRAVRVSMVHDHLCISLCLCAYLCYGGLVSVGLIRMYSIYRGSAREYVIFRDVFVCLCVCVVRSCGSIHSIEFHIPCSDTHTKTQKQNEQIQNEDRQQKESHRIGIIQNFVRICTVCVYFTVETETLKVHQTPWYARV